MAALKAETKAGTGCGGCIAGDAGTERRTGGNRVIEVKQQPASTLLIRQELFIIAWEGIKTFENCWRNTVREATAAEMVSRPSVALYWRR